MSYRRNRPGVLSIAMIALFAVFVILPLYWVVITSIKPSDDYLATPPVFFPTHPTLLHYTAALFAYRGLTGLLNSVIVASATTVLSALPYTSCSPPPLPESAPNSKGPVERIVPLAVPPEATT